MFEIQFLLPPLIAVLGLGFVLSLTMRKFKNTKFEQLSFGVLFGITITLGMNNPLSMGEGLIYDPRTLLLTAAVAFAGPAAGAIAMCFGIVTRLWVGGAGALPGVVGLMLAFLISFAWMRYVSGRFKNRILHDLCLGLAATTSITVLFLLPYEAAVATLKLIVPMLLIINPVGLMVLGLVFRHKLQNFVETQVLHTHACTDQLTHLLNRRGLDRQIDHMKSDVGKGHALLYFDIDKFKDINDTFGHDAGDATLAIIAARIKETLRSDAIFARHGGDEFSIYLPDVDPKDVQSVADRLCSTVSSEKICHKDIVFQATISVGGYWTRQKMGLQCLIDCADAQLLLAKRAGKNRNQVAYDRNAKAVALAVA